MSYLSPNYKKYFIVASFFLFSCSGSDDLDLVNIDSEVIIFQENVPNENNFPNMRISTIGQVIVDEPKINAELIVSENNIESDYKIGIEIRGSSSQIFPKKSYGFETRSSDWSEDLDVSLGGFPEEEDWILYGPYSDKSLIRNKLTFDLSNSIGYKASRVKFYNLFINNDYKGLYVLMEKIKRDQNRVDVTELEGDNVNGCLSAYYTSATQVIPIHIRMALAMRISKTQRQVTDVQELLLPSARWQLQAAAEWTRAGGPERAAPGEG